MVEDYLKIWNFYVRFTFAYVDKEVMITHKWYLSFYIFSLLGTFVKSVVFNK